jgi:hypothetical protein
VRLVIETVWPLLIVVELRLISAPEVPTPKSMTAVVPSCAKARAKVAVPDATAVPLVIAFAVETPDAGAPKLVVEKVSVASTVLPERAVSTVAGLVPE